MHAVILHQYRAFLLYTHKIQLILIQLLAMIFEIILTILALVTFDSPGLLHLPCYSSE